MSFSKIHSYHPISDDVTKQYYHSNRISVTRFSTSKILSNVADVSALIQVTQQRHFVALAILARPKQSYL